MNYIKPTEARDIVIDLTNWYDEVDIREMFVGDLGIPEEYIERGYHFNLSKKRSMKDDVNYLPMIDTCNKYLNPDIIGDDLFIEVISVNSQMYETADKLKVSGITFKSLTEEEKENNGFITRIEFLDIIKRLAYRIADEIYFKDELFENVILTEDEAEIDEQPPRNSQISIVDEDNRKILSASYTVKAFFPLIASYLSLFKIADNSLISSASLYALDYIDRKLEIPEKDEDGFFTSINARIQNLLLTRIRQTSYSDRVIWSYLKNDGISPESFAAEQNRLLLSNLPKVKAKSKDGEDFDIFSKSTKSIVFSTVSFMHVFIKNQLKFQFQRNLPVNFRPVMQNGGAGTVSVFEREFAKSSQDSYQIAIIETALRAEIDSLLAYVEPPADFYDDILKLTGVLTLNRHNLSLLKIHSPVFSDAAQTVSREVTIQYIYLLHLKLKLNRMSAIADILVSNCEVTGSKRAAATEFDFGEEYSVITPRLDSLMSLLSGVEFTNQLTGKVNKYKIRLIKGEFSRFSGIPLKEDEVD